MYWRRLFFIENDEESTYLSSLLPSIFSNHHDVNRFYLLNLLARKRGLISFELTNEQFVETYSSDYSVFCNMGIPLLRKFIESYQKVWGNELEFEHTFSVYNKLKPRTISYNILSPIPPDEMNPYLMRFDRLLTDIYDMAAHRRSIPIDDEYIEVPVEEDKLNDDFDYYKVPKKAKRDVDSDDDEYVVV